MQIGRMLIAGGLLLVVAGILVMLATKANLPFGRLPGDVVMRGKRTSFYFPIATSIIISIVLSLLLWIFNRR